MSKPEPESTLASPGSAVQPTSYEVVAEIVESNPSIESLTLVTYHEGPNWRDVAQPETKELPVLIKGIRQDAGERVLSRLLRAEVTAERLKNVAQSLRTNQLVGVISRVTVAGGELRHITTRHIPMMDFMCPPSPANLEVLTRLFREIGQKKGYLLESGRSYHYYGLELLTEEQWRVFLGKCLLMCGYVDDRYVGHQLVDGHCVLRLSSGKLKPNVPKVVAKL
jgi:hypothetical protein